jgi:hypothetical protein
MPVIALKVQLRYVPINNVIFTALSRGARGELVPKLTVLAVCEKVIIDRVQTPSLIGIFQGLNIQLTNEPMPEKAITPLRWSIFTLWQHDPEERGTEFTQYMEVITPSGEQFVKGETKFKVTEVDDLQSKIGYDLVSIPVHEQGFFTVRIWLENEAESKAEYKFFLKLLPAPVAEESPTIGVVS